MSPVSLLLLLLTSPDPESQTLSAGFTGGSTTRTTGEERGGPGPQGGDRDHRLLQGLGGGDRDHHLLQGLGLGLGEGRVLPVPPDSPTSTGGRYRGVEHAGVVLFRSMCAME